MESISNWKRALSIFIFAIALICLHACVNGRRSRNTRQQTPEAVAIKALDAIKEGNIISFTQMLTPEDQKTMNDLISLARVFGYDLEEVISEDEFIHNVLQAVDYEFLTTEFNEGDNEAIVFYKLKFPFYSRNEEMRLVKMNNQWYIDL